MPLLLVENEDSPPARTCRRFIRSIPDNASSLATIIADKISLVGATRQERILSIEEVLRLAHAQICDERLINRALEGLREDARLLDIPASRLIREL